MGFSAIKTRTRATLRDRAKIINFREGGERVRTRLIFSAGWAALCIPVVSSAVMPTSFGGWAATSGTVSATCPSGVVCTDVAQSSGFLQRSLKDESGKTYFQTIILESGASGLPGALNFSTENFVRRNADNTSGPTGGIANRQIIKDDSINKWDKTNSTFSMDSTIKTKWSTDTTSPSIVTNQSINESGTSFDTKFLSTYKFEANISELGVRSGYAYDIGQLFSQKMGKDQSTSGGDGCKDNGCSTTTPYEVQGFARRLRSGDLSKSAGVGTIPATGHKVTWGAGETVAVTWAGQVMSHWEKLENNKDGTPGWEDLEMSFQAYENLSTGQAPARYLAYGSSAPLDWNSATFGAAPTMPNLPKGVTRPASDSKSSTTTSSGIKPTESQYQAVPVSLTSIAPSDSPVQFSSWSVSNGVITAACPPGAVVCIGAHSSEGFLQRSLKGADGKDYFQLIVTDSDATGTPSTLAFASESLVRMGSSAQNGIISQMLLRDVGNSMFGFADRAVVRTGWADSATQPNIDIEHHFATKIPSEFFEFKNDFAYKANMDAANDRTGFWMDISQVQVGTWNLGTRGASSTAFSSRTDQGMFVRREIAGDMLTASGSLASGDKSSGLSWVAGDDIKVTWFGQVFNGGNEATPRFYYQAYDRVNDLSAPSRSADRDKGPGPTSWHTVFGTKPVWPFATTTNK